MAIFLLIVQLIPSIIEIVKQIETLIPGAGQGPIKLALVLDTVNAAAQASPGLVSSIAHKDLAGILTNIVGIIVKTLNATGAFTPKV